MPTSQTDPAATAENPISTTEVPFSPTCPPPAGITDEREQTFDEGRIGPVHSVSTPADLITSLRTIMLDEDLKFLRPTLYAGTGGTAAERLYDR